MWKKNLIGIFVVILMLGTFIVGYQLGRQSNTKSGTPGMGHPTKPGTTSGNTSRQNTSSEQKLKSEEGHTKLSEKKLATNETTNKSTSNPTGQVFYGTVIPYEEANVQGEQGAAIIQLKYKEGDQVKKGQVLVKLSDNTKKLELIKAQSARKLSQQQVTQNEFNYNTELKNYERSEQLFKDNLLSGQEFDNIKNKSQTAASSLEIARQNLIQAKTQIQIIEATMKNYIIKAPISGIIDRKQYNLGEVYRSGDIIYHLINVDQVYAEIKIPETYLNELKKGMQVMVSFNALDDQKFPGTVETILFSGDTESRNFTTKIKIKNSDHFIKPGMFAIIQTNGENAK